MHKSSKINSKIAGPNLNAAKKWFLKPFAKICPCNEKSLQLGNKIQKKFIPLFLTLIKSEARTFSEKDRKKNKLKISVAPRS